MTGHRKGIEEVGRFSAARCSAVAACLVIGIVLTCFAAPASALVSHSYSHSIGSAFSTPAAPYPVSGPTDVAVDQTDGAIYVTDPPNHRVQKFSSTGEFILMFGKGVNETTGGNICTADSGNTCKAGVAVGSQGGFQSPGYLAIDNYPGGEGDLYVADSGNNTVQKFNSSGGLITSWGANGQKDGSDGTGFATSFATIYGIAVGGGCVTPEKPIIVGNCEPNGDFYVVGKSESTGFGLRAHYTRNGEYLWYTQVLGPGLKVDPEGNYYGADSSFFGGGEFGIYKFTPRKGSEGESDYREMASDRPTISYAFDPETRELFQVTGERTEGESHPPRVNRYSGDCAPETDGPCDPLNSFGSAQLSNPKGIDVDGSSHSVYVANPGSNEVLVFGDARPIVTTEEPTGVTDTSITLTGNVDPAGRGDVTECRFEYGFDTTYGKTLPCTPDPASAPPGSHFTAPTDVTATVSGLSPGTTGHYRLVAGNDADASAFGVDRTFRTTAAPAIVSLAAERLTATSADLIARINPNGRETTYHFEYGPTVEYGTSVPVDPVTLAAVFTAEPIEVHLEGLTPHTIYHYRLVAESESGITTVEDHTFNFYPPECPNSNVRQQTQANFLPDCRAYELVSPADTGGTQLFPFGPNTGQATDPSRLAFTGVFSTIPGSGGSPSDTSGDLYVATRTPTEWITRYVGWPSSEAPSSGGPMMGPPGSAPGPIPNVSNLEANGRSPLGRLQGGVLTDLKMSRFLSFKLGSEGESNRTPIGSNAPKVFAADGTLLDRWPTNLATVPDGEYPDYPEDSYLYGHAGYPFPGEEPAEIAPGGTRALDCPAAVRGGQANNGYCPGDVTASADLNHFVFASGWNVFAPGGQLGGAGSVYDNDTRTGSVTVASRSASGDSIQPEPGNHSEDPLQIPAVSADGSHILMAAGATGPCGYATCPLPPCSSAVFVKRCPMQPSRLYMRVDASVTYDVSQGHAVDYVGTDRSGSKVYFLSEEQITADDLDTSADLYLWSESTNDITLVSKADNAGNLGEPGNSDDCGGGIVTHHDLFSTKCGVTVYTQWLYCTVAPGGNCLSDGPIAAASGDIYFFSQELLDGTRGIPNQQNLYVSHGDSVRYVTTLTGTPSCFVAFFSKESCQRMLRMQITPDGSYMAFVTSSPITQYDNDRHSEMYRYRLSDGELVCVSCRPDGEPPTSNTEASLNGLFMANDGRIFFTTEDPLVHVDTNQAQDVYEYVNGRPQLITLGTGDTRAPKTPPVTASAAGRPGLVGVSADGNDVFFGTYDTLVRQDHNGLFLKFYDARSGGGFSAPAPPPPCAAADECHGPATSPPPPLASGTGTALGDGGNVASTKQKNKKGKKKRAKRRKKTRRGGK
jgi:hypothetical protein